MIQKIDAHFIDNLMLINFDSEAVKKINSFKQKSANKKQHNLVDDVTSLSLQKRKENK